MPGSLTGGACSLVAGCGPASSLLGGATQAAAGSVLDAFSSWLSAGASWLVGRVVTLVSLTTSVDLGSGWFAQRQAALARPLGLVLLALLLAATIGAVARQDLRRLARAWLVALPAAVLTGLAGVQLADLALAVSDELSNMVSAGGGGGATLHGAFSGIAASAAVPGAPALVTCLVSVLLIAGTVLLWLELVVRAAAVYIAVAFVPLALAGLVWPATAHVAKRLVEVLAALVFSKFVIVATLTLGAAAVSAAPSAEATVTGAAILLLAAFAPFAVLRLVPVVEAAAVAHLEGLSRRPGRALDRAARAAATAPAHPVVALLRSGQAGAGPPGGPEAVLPQPIPERAPGYLLGPDPAGPAGDAPPGRRGVGGPGVGPPGPDEGGSGHDAAPVPRPAGAPAARDEPPVTGRDAPGGPDGR